MNYTKIRNQQIDIQYQKSLEDLGIDQLNNMEDKN